jgi:hypothetical protein
MSYLRSVRLYPQLLVGGLMCYLRSVRLYPQLLVGGLMCYLRSVRKDELNVVFMWKS